MMKVQLRTIQGLDLAHLSLFQYQTKFKQVKESDDEHNNVTTIDDITVPIYAAMEFSLKEVKVEKVEGFMV